MNIPPQHTGNATTRNQQGVVLFIALIVLVTMTLAGLALIRSVDTSNVIAGNLAFRQGAVQASDAGVEAVVAALPGIIAASQSTNIPNKYYATMQTLDVKGIPSGINWDNAPSMAVTDPVGGGNLYKAYYVIERMCSVANVTNIEKECVSTIPEDNSSHKKGAPKFNSTSGMYYRVTLRVNGPRNTVSYVQVVLQN